MLNFRGVGVLGFESFDLVDPKKAGVIQQYVGKGLFFRSEKLILRMGLEPAMQASIHLLLICCVVVRVLFHISSELDF